MDTWVYITCIVIISVITWAIYVYGHLVIYLGQFIQTKIAVYRFKSRRWTVPDLFQERVQQSPSKSAIEFEGRVYSYGDIDRLSSRVSHWFIMQLQHQEHHHQQQQHASTNTNTISNSKSMTSTSISLDSSTLPSAQSFIQYRSSSSSSSSSSSASGSGSGSGYTVGLLMDNRVEFVVLWLGLSKVGVNVALMQCGGAGGRALVHAVNAVSGAEKGGGAGGAGGRTGAGAGKIKMLIVGVEQAAKIREVLPKNNNNNENDGLTLDDDVLVYVCGEINEGTSTIPPITLLNRNNNNSSSSSSSSSNNKTSGGNDVVDDRMPDITHIFSDRSDNVHTHGDMIDFKKYRADQNSNDVLFHIYTSGTTGLPKAARVKHIRFFLGACSFSVFNRITASDRVYTTMPLYHSAAGIVGVGMCWYSGATLVLRRKFSASAFFRDCRILRCTVIQYIGELARYLLSTQPSDDDRSHHVTKAIGNGMSADVWIAFQKRFGIGYIGEFYASTEGNCNLLNNQNKVGAMGYIPDIATLLYPIRIVKFDVDKEMPIRNKQGFLVDCANGEVGELIGKIDTNDPLRSFDGYASSSSTNDKILLNAFKKNDSWFRTGDLVVRDSAGFLYFRDRIGDTFRWKGENVSTCEVSSLLMSCRSPVLFECCVYGVSVPHCSGRAGMASIVLASSSSSSSSSSLSVSDASLLYAHVTRVCAPYMQPLFIRIPRTTDTSVLSSPSSGASSGTGAAAVTATFKHRKGDLVRDGFDLELVSAHGADVWFKDDEQKTYVPMNQEIHQRIRDGKQRL